LGIPAAAPRPVPVLFIGALWPPCALRVLRPLCVRGWCSECRDMACRRQHFSWPYHWRGV